MDKTILEAIKTEAKKPCSGCNRCPDFDEDCKEVVDHLACFIGINKEGVDIGIAKGYCPFIHAEN